MNFSAIIKKPLVTEKNTILAAADTYAFEVDVKSSKIQIKAAIETAFQVKVLEVRTLNCRGRVRRTMRGPSKVSYWKKAFVRLAPNQKIHIFEGA
jgi:large subunit ribosomal protein L23